MVRTKSVYGVPDERDGVRVLVTRYWPRGVKKEAQDRWIRDLGPEPSLIKKWKAGDIEWPEFERAYREEFKKDAQKRELLAWLKSIVETAGKDVTLLCTCKEEEDCHRKLLKEMLER